MHRRGVFFVGAAEGKGCRVADADAGADERGTESLMPFGCTSGPGNPGATSEC